MTERALAIVGPTATGKSALALAIAERWDGEIVNADALQAYRGLEIGTAKPSRAERARVPHHLLDILEPTESFSAGDFARRARAAIAEVSRRRRLAIVVGGSGLYLRALWSGIAPMPPSDPRIRSELERELERVGVEGLADRLAELDPESGARLGRRDAQRILRALEVHRLTGRTISDWIRETPYAADAFPMRKFGLTLPRAVLYDRIEARAREMLRRGWVEEIRSLLDGGVPAEAVAFQAIGYRELVGAIRGRSSVEEATSKLVIRTRRFAKRQESWFRGETGIEWHDAREIESRRAEFAGAVGSGDGGRRDEQAEHQYPGRISLSEPEGRTSDGA